MGNMELLCMQCSRIEIHLVARGSLMVFIELRQYPGVYSRDTVGDDPSKLVFVQ